VATVLFIPLLVCSLFILQIGYVYQGRFVLTVAGATVIMSLMIAVLFLAFFYLGYLCTEFYLAFNEWVYEVEDMCSLFNRNFMVWLLAKYPRRWAKRAVASSFLLAACFGIWLYLFITKENTTFQVAWQGTLLSTTITVLFSFAFYKNYISKIDASTS